MTLFGSARGFINCLAWRYQLPAGSGGISIMASLNAVPFVALAPRMNNWLGDGVASRIGIVLELMTSYAASARQLFLKLRLPKALPAIFSAFKINMSTSIIGAIVGEFFIASRGLGYLLSEQIRLANMPLAWACIVIAAILGIALYTIIQLLEKRLIPWAVSQR